MADQLPCIEQTIEKPAMHEHTRIYISVRGDTLDECLDVFDKVKKKYTE